MKCPHCGMNLRDDITECGYCGGKIARPRQKAAAGAGGYTVPKSGTAQKGAAPSKKQSEEPGMDEEEEGGLSAILQPGEQVLVGALNVAVKKFSFHAYLTNQRIFLIDTMEKKLRVTAKDIPRDTIVGSIVEFSESSDPVLVLSTKTGEDETKTMKLVFTQGGTDRAGEIDEWLALLHDEEPGKKTARKPTPRAEEPEESEEPEEFEYEEPVPPRVPEKPRQKQELQPARRSVKKDHERQPPVKRLLSLYNVPEEEPAAEPEPEAPPRKMQVRQVITTSYDKEVPPARETEGFPIRKPEVQSAMKVAMKGAIRQAGPVSQKPVKRAVIESQPPAPSTEEYAPEPVPGRRPVVTESAQVRHSEKPVPEEVTDATPQFCHNCGKKLPHSANFCPGCGTKLSIGRTLPHSRTSPTLPTRKTTRTDPPGHENRPPVVDEEEIEEEKPVPTRPPVKKAPKGSEMTILHKFLRR
jgi:hypothetical protein